jgi:hypothetical protein
MAQAAVPRYDILQLLYASTSYEFRSQILYRKRNLFVPVVVSLESAYVVTALVGGNDSIEYAYI